MGVAGTFAACSPKAPKFQGVDLTGAEYARDLQLTDHNGQPRSLKDFAGKVVVVFFGYTQCPDVCPTSMSELADVKRALGADGDKLQGIFDSVDPERDTPEVLKAYMANYKRVEGQTPTSYTMAPSAGSYVYDPAGRLRVYHRYGSGAQSLAADVRALLDETR